MGAILLNAEYHTGPIISGARKHLLPAWVCSLDCF